MHASARCVRVHVRVAKSSTLAYHTAWTGPIDKYVTEFAALLDSWLMTQDTSRSTFHFWWMDRDPDPNDPFLKHYTELSGGKCQPWRATRVIPCGVARAHAHAHVPTQGATPSTQPRARVATRAREGADQPQRLLLTDYST